MRTKNLRHLARYAQLTLLGLLCVMGSFAMGIQTAGDVDTIALTEAGDTNVTDDVTGDGLVDLEDVILILEVERGYREPTPAELLADPNGDGRLTADDAIRLLKELAAS